MPQGCLLSMVFIVALHVPWCRRVEAMPAFKPQLYADNLKCSVVCPNALCGAAGFTAQYVRSLNQDVSAGKCVLLSTSKAIRKSMKLWDVSGDGKPWKVELDVGDLGGTLDFTKRTTAGTLSRRVKEATHGIAALGALPWGWAWFGVSICLLDYMLLRRRRFLLPPQAQCLLPTPRLFLIFWMTRLAWTLLSKSFGHGFRTMRRYLAHRPEEMVLMDIGRCICCLCLLRLGLLGMERRGVGFVLHSPAQEAFGAYPTFSERYF